MAHISKFKYGDLITRDQVSLTGDTHCMGERIEYIYIDHRLIYYRYTEKSRFKIFSEGIQTLDIKNWGDGWCLYNAPKEKKANAWMRFIAWSKYITRDIPR